MKLCGFDAANDRPIVLSYDGDEHKVEDRTED